MTLSSRPGLRALIDQARLFVRGQGKRTNDLRDGG